MEFKYLNTLSFFVILVSYVNFAQADKTLFSHELPNTLAVNLASSNQISLDGVGSGLAGSADFIVYAGAGIIGGLLGGIAGGIIDNSGRGVALGMLAGGLLGLGIVSISNEYQNGVNTHSQLMSLSSERLELPWQVLSDLSLASHDCRASVDPHAQFSTYYKF